LENTTSLPVVFWQVDTPALFCAYEYASIGLSVSRQKSAKTGSGPETSVPYFRIFWRDWSPCSGVA